jgi:hypothetical protein
MQRHTKIRIIYAEAFDLPLVKLLSADANQDGSEMSGIEVPGDRHRDRGKHQ